jgi:hypothetical protein
MKQRRIAGYVLSFVALVGAIVSLVFYIRSRSSDEWGVYLNEDYALLMVECILYILMGVYMVYSSYKGKILVGLEGIGVALSGGIAFAYGLKVLLDVLSDGEGNIALYSIVLSVGIFFMLGGIGITVYQIRSDRK